MRYWWVNQNQPFRAELRGSFMWSPKRNANGARNQFYENMREVSPGDIVFSFCDASIKAIAVVTGAAQTGPKPDFGSAGLNWSKEGWFVPADYCTLDNQIRPKDHAAILRPFLPTKYSPLQESGDGLQSAYLAQVPLPLARALIASPRRIQRPASVAAHRSSIRRRLPHLFQQPGTDRRAGSQRQASRRVGDRCQYAGW